MLNNNMPEILEEEDQELQTLMNNISENFYSADWENNQVTYISPVCLKLYGYPPEAFFADHQLWFKLIHPDDKEKIAKSNERLRNGKKTTREYRIIHADGSVRWVSSTIVPTLGATGKVIRVDGCTTDITERKMATSKIEELTMVIGRVSHDLRGPLNSAKNYIAIAMDDITDAPTLDYLKKINGAYNSMEQQLLSLLSLERVHCSILKPELLDINGLVTDIINSINNITGFNKVKIETDLQLNEEIYCDKIYMHSIIYNLINNAIAYRRDIPNAFVHITAYFDYGDLVFSVSDNGVGIPAAIRDNVFQKFVKGDTKDSGLGLGLFIVNSLVEKLGGCIGIESEEMKGTTFNLRLPMLAKIPG